MLRALPIALALLALGAMHARASVEEFSTFSVVNQELDDESLLDHYLTRPPLMWRDEWEHSASGLYTSQGCLTSGHWFIDTDLLVRAPMGKKAWFGANLLQSQSDISSYQYLDLLFRFPMPVGTFGAMFRPMADKSAQDFSLSWQFGSDTSAYQLEAIFTFEDIFNNFWAFRQTQVGELSEPYLQRPYEPALHFTTRHDHWRADVAGKWLTPSRKSIVHMNTGINDEYHDIWGVLGTGEFEFDVGRTTFGARGSNMQAREHDNPLILALPENLSYRRQWLAEGFVRRPLPVWKGMMVQARYVYEGRIEFGGPPDQQAILRCDDRMMNLDVTATLSRTLTARVGGLFDRIGVDQSHKSPLWFTWGTRNESRAYLSLIARFGRVSVTGIEGIELDPEPYPVTFHHDKGFLQLQTTF